MFLVEKVGGNLDMTDNGHIGGERVFCDKYLIAKKKQQIKLNISQLSVLQTYLVELFVALKSLMAKNNSLILGMELIFLRRNFEMRVIEKNSFTGRQVSSRWV